MGKFNFTKWLNDTATIYYLDTVTDGFGGYKKTWTRKYYNTPVRIYGDSGNIVIAEQGINYIVEKRLLCDVDIEINKGDKVEVGDESYIVLRSTKRGANTDHHTACMLGRLEETSG